MANLQDIADRTGFSVATVSKALRGFREISADTRKKIAQAARDLGYQEKSAPIAEPAPTLAGTVGIISVEIRSNYYARIVTALEASLLQSGYSTLLGLSDFEYDREKNILERFALSGVDGIICVTNSGKIEQDLRTFRDKNDVPVVLLAPAISHADFDYVRNSDNFGIQSAVQHLVDLGHRSIGFIGDIRSKIRLNYLVDVLTSRGLTPKPEHLRIGQERFEQSGYLRMRELLSSEAPPTAVIASYDDVAIGAMYAVSQAGLSVPEDISIIGFDGIEAGAFLPVPLTTMAAHVDEMADAAVNMLRRKIEDQSYTIVQHLEFNSELVVRSSTGPPRKYQK